MERNSSLLDEALGIFNDNNNNNGSTSTSSCMKKGSVMLIEDSVETSAAFVIHHLLKRFLSCSSQSFIVFVSFSNPFSHYDQIFVQWLSPPDEWIALNIDGASRGNPGPSGAGGVFRDSTGRFIMAYAEHLGHGSVTRAELLALRRGLIFAAGRGFRKLLIQTDSKGCNLAAHRDNRRFIFIDMLMLGCSGPSEGNRKGGLVELYGNIQKVVEDIACSSGSNKHITIVVDDISLIEVAAKGSYNHSLDFLRYCYTLTSEAGCSLVMLTHEDIYCGEENSRVIIQMEYLANILIKAEPLATGQAADVHGQLTILNKGTDCTPKSSSMNKVQNFHFKIKENGVECFYPGAQP